LRKLRLGLSCCGTSVWCRKTWHECADHPSHARSITQALATRPVGVVNVQRAASRELLQTTNNVYGTGIVWPDNQPNPQQLPMNFGYSPSTPNVVYNLCPSYGFTVTRAMSATCTFTLPPAPYGASLWIGIFRNNKAGPSAQCTGVMAPMQLYVGQARTYKRVICGIAAADTHFRAIRQPPQSTLPTRLLRTKLQPSMVWFR
jgi:hypothetical protein